MGQVKIFFTLLEAVKIFRITNYRFALKFSFGIIGILNST